MATCHCPTGSWHGQQPHSTHHTEQARKSPTVTLPSGRPVLMLVATLLFFLLHCTDAIQPCADRPGGANNFLNRLNSGRAAACRLDAHRSKPSTRLNCSSQTCCFSSDCSATNPTAWLCACDGRCGANRCFLTSGSCGNLQPPLGGRYTQEGSGWVRLACGKGFRRIGPVRRRCVNGKWIRGAHKCVHRCKPPDLPAKAELYSPAKRYYIHNNVVFARCKRGFKLIADRVFKLQCRHGRWRPRLEHFLCVPDLQKPCCQLPPVPLHGSVLYLSGRNQSICRGEAFRYRCDGCYALPQDTRDELVCTQPQQQFQAPVCVIKTCHIDDVPLPPGGVFLQVVADVLPTEYNCRQTVTIACGGIHDDFTARQQQMLCLPNRSWTIGDQHDELRCTPSAVRDIQLDNAWDQSVRISWHPPAILPNYTTHYEVSVTPVGDPSDSAAVLERAARKLVLPVRDRRLGPSDRFHVTLNDLMPNMSYHVNVTAISDDGLAGGSSQLTVMTLSQFMGPLRCVIRNDKLVLSWAGGFFPTHASFKMSYRTGQPVVPPYSQSGEHRILGEMEVMLDAAQPFTPYTLHLTAEHDQGTDQRSTNCTLSSATIAPRPPPAPEAAFESGQLVVTLHPSPDLFVSSYELIMDKYQYVIAQSRYVLQNNYKFSLTPDELPHATARSAGVERRFSEVQLSANGESVSVQLAAISESGARSLSKQARYIY